VWRERRREIPFRHFLHGTRRGLSKREEIPTSRGRQRERRNGNGGIPVLIEEK